MAAASKMTKAHLAEAVQASSPTDWRHAPRPNYRTNQNLQFPYSEYPRTFGSGSGTYEYVSTLLDPQPRTQILDFWGEGRLVDGHLVTGFPDSYNVNHQFQLVSNGADTGKKIPNRIPTKNYDDVSIAKYVSDASFDIITLMGAPIAVKTAAEMARIIRADSHSVIVLYGIEASDPPFAVLQRQLQLSGKDLVLSPYYALSPQLQQVTLTPKLALCPSAAVVQQATSFFLSKQMPECATVLCSLYRSAKIQSAATVALTVFFSQTAVRNSPLIFKLGYELQKHPDGPAVRSEYMNANVVKIVTGAYTTLKIRSNRGTAAYLCPNGKVAADNYQWAFFGTSKYIDGSASYKGGEKLTLVPTTSKEQFQIKASFGTTSYLCTNHAVTDGSWQWAFFGTAKYLEAATYNKGQYFQLLPVNGGQTFKVVSGFSVTSRLCTNGSVSAGSWQYGFFGSDKYMDANPSYKDGETFTLEFQ